jgi:acetyl esterase/lipase
MGNWQAKLSIWGYGAVTGTFFRANASPQSMRKWFERPGATSRARLQRKYPQLKFEDHYIDGGLYAESVCAVQGPKRALLYLHGGA